MLEQLPRLLDRNFLLGFFIPVTLYQAVGRVLMSPSWKVQYLIGRWENDPTTGLIFVIIISVILVYLLVAFNQLLLIFLEGYYPPINSMPWLKDRQLRRWRRIKSQIDQVDKAWNTLECGPRERFVEAQYERTSNIALLAREFPGQSDYILPTRFGNVIRAFEFYPKAMYGIDSISVWPRLIKIISDKSDEQITAAKTFVDFYVNLTYLSFLLLPLLIARMIYNVHANNSYGFIQSVLTIWWQPVALLGIVGGIWVFYKASVIAAISWGSQVKSTFDLYIDDLARNLGYCSPLSRDVWVEISQSFAHNDPLPPKSLHYPAVSPDTSKHPPP